MRAIISIVLFSIASLLSSCESCGSTTRSQTTDGVIPQENIIDDESETGNVRGDSNDHTNVVSSSNSENENASKK